MLLLPGAALSGLAQMFPSLGGDGEVILIGPIELLPGQDHLIIAKRSAMDSGGSCPVGAAVSDYRTTYNEAWPVGFGLGGLDGGRHPVQVVAVQSIHHMPPVGSEATRHVFKEGDVSVSLDGNLVIVINEDELSQAQRSRQ